MSQRRDKKSGFTIVEVTIAMAFIAVLVITLLMVGMRIASLYNKGITIRDVNSASRNIIRSMQDDIAASSSRMVVFYRKASSGSGGGGGSSSASSGDVKFATNLEEATKEKIHYYNDPNTGGRLCTGSYTYIWNYRTKFIEYNTKSKNSDGSLVSDSARKSGAQYYRSGSALARFEPVRFMKVKDDQRILCSSEKIATMKAGYGSAEYRNGLRIPDEFIKDSVAVLGDSERGLVIYSMDVFYTINMTIGSSLFDEEYIGSVADKDVKNSNCRTDINSQDSYAEYCALNNIEFVARTGSV